MSKYTTGELAKLCGVSVRTVQYYDERGILVPGELSEGGRRLYSDADLSRMRVICFLREMDISINSIARLFKEEKPEAVIDLLLDEQEKLLLDELNERRERLEKVRGMRRRVREIEGFSVESIGDIAHIMKNKKELRRLHAVMLLTGIPISALQVTSIILWVCQGIWWVFAVWLISALVYGSGMSLYYFRRVAYICPACHETFKPRFREAFFANHTPTLRKLTCPHCSHKGFCVEIYQKEENTHE